MIDNFEIFWLTLVGSLVFPSSMNVVFDHLLVPVYTIIAVLAIAAFWRNSRMEVTNQRRVYVYKKKSKMDSLTWKQKFAGKWEKTERPGFCKFLVFMGKIPAWMASSMEKSIEGKPWTNSIEFQDDSEKVLKIDSFGVPENKGPWVTFGGGTVTFSSDGEHGTESMHWDEEEKTLVRTRDVISLGIINTQYRKLIDDNTLFFRNVTKRGNDVNEFTAKFKRIED